MLKKLRYGIEYVFTWLIFTLFRLLPMRVASAIGAGLGWVIAALPTGFNTTARRNLRFCFSDWPEDKIRRTQRASFMNFMRTMVEMPHVYRLSPKKFARITTTNGAELADKYPQTLMLTGHMGNWDMLSHWLAQKDGLKLAAVYRAANNPMVDKLMVNLRSRSGIMPIAKGAKGARLMLKAIKEGYSIGLLNDQKMNDGIPAPFFGTEVMTAPGAAEIAAKKNLPILMGRCLRKPKGRFELTLFPPLEIEKTDDDAENARRYVTAYNQILEGWIREYPEQWLWVHRRFPNDAVAKP